LIHNQQIKERNTDGKLGNITKHHWLVNSWPSQNWTTIGHTNQMPIKRQSNKVPIQMISHTINTDLAQLVTLKDFKCSTWWCGTLKLKHQNNSWCQDINAELQSANLITSIDQQSIDLNVVLLNKSPTWEIVNTINTNLEIGNTWKYLGRNSWKESPSCYSLVHESNTP
jgi:hypothetical protein